MSKVSSANGSAVAVAHTAGTVVPRSASMRRECCSWRSDTSRPTAWPPCSFTQREHWPAPQPSSSTRLPVTSPSSRVSSSVWPSGPHTKPASPRNAPWVDWYSSA